MALAISDSIALSPDAARAVTIHLQLADDLLAVLSEFSSKRPEGVGWSGLTLCHGHSLSTTARISSEMTETFFNLCNRRRSAALDREWHKRGNAIVSAF